MLEPLQNRLHDSRVGFLGVAVVETRGVHYEYAVVLVDFRGEREIDHRMLNRFGAGAQGSTIPDVHLITPHLTEQRVDELGFESSKYCIPPILPTAE